ncbi:MAG: class I SAM-dependent methyltransferase [Psychroflexus sp.]|nr:class I SAM-dependent methyltransferase [Psychroflexus sp.]
MKIKDFAHTQEEFELREVEAGLYKTQKLPKDLDRFYDFEEYISHDQNRKGFIGHIYDTVKNYMFSQKLNLIKKYASEAPQILDYGCGTGDFLKFLQDRDYAVQGIEPTEKAQKIASQKGLKIHASLQEINEKFDVISLFHVLEHVEDFQSLIKQLRGKLNANGILIIAVPNHKSKDAQIYQEFWAAWDVPRHIWHFSKIALIEKIKIASFNLLTTKPLFFDAIYISIVSERYKKGDALKGVINGFYANINALFTKSWSSHIFVFKKD